MFKVATLRNPFSVCSGGGGGESSASVDVSDHIMMEDACMISIPSASVSGSMEEKVITRPTVSCSAYNPCDGIMCEGEAMDVILIKGPSDSSTSNNHHIVSSSDFFVRFPRTHNVVCELQLLEPPDLTNDTNNNNESNKGSSCSYWKLDEIMKPRKSGTNNKASSSSSSGNFIFANSSSKPSQTALQQLASQCKPGKNIARYALYSNEETPEITTTNADKQDEQLTKRRLICGSATLHIYVWDYNDRIIVSDVDGTITKSNARGIMDTIVLERYAYVHDGICQFWQQFLLAQHHQQEQEQKQDEVAVPSTGSGQLRMLYLSSRPMSLVQSTRQFLCQLRQGSHSLPEGPLFCNLQHTHQVLLSELVYKDVATIKADILVRQVVLPFAAAATLASTEVSQSNERSMSSRAESTKSPLCTQKHPQQQQQQQQQVFFAGFGNTTADCQAYEMAGMHRHDIYMIDKQSKIVCIDKVDHHQKHQFSSSNNKATSSCSSLSLSARSVLSTKTSSSTIITSTSTTTTPVTANSSDTSQGDPNHSNNKDNKQLNENDQHDSYNNKNTTNLDIPTQKFQLLSPARRKRSYKKLSGTSFNGYKDARLITCLQAKLER